MKKPKEFYVCEICGISVPRDLSGCPICNPFKNLFLTGARDGSLFPKLEDVDLEEAVRRNRDFFRNFEHELNPQCTDTDKLPDEFSAEKVRRFLGEN